MPHYSAATLSFDGACRENPNGEAGCGWNLTNDADGRPIGAGRRYLGASGYTSNVAEYFGLIEGLRYLKASDVEVGRLRVRGDSQLVIEQVGGNWRARSGRLRPLFRRARDLLSPHEYELKHVGRKDNREADALANEAISTGANHITEHWREEGDGDSERQDAAQLCALRNPVDQTIVFVDVDVGLFQACFGKEELWNNCRFKIVPSNASEMQLQHILFNSGPIAAVVFDDDNYRHWETLRHYYLGLGGSLVFFGIIGEFAAPQRISSQLGFSWKYCAYTNHEYQLTPRALSHLGDKVTTQQYTKSNLIQVPEKDRWMTPKIYSMSDYLVNYCGLEETIGDSDYWDEIQRAQDKYPSYCEEQYSQCPLAVHEGESGGRFIYLGFVNGDGNIPKIVRGLLLHKTID